MDLDLTHKGTQRRITKFLAAVDAKGDETWLRIELNDACGLPNKPLGKYLRTMFLQVQFYSPRSNVWNEYRPIKGRIEELRSLMKNIGLGDE